MEVFLHSHLEVGARTRRVKTWRKEKFRAIWGNAAYFSSICLEGEGARTWARGPRMPGKESDLIQEAAENHQKLGWEVM